MSKKGLEKFYKEALPTLLKNYKSRTHYNNVYFEGYDAKCYIRKANGQIEEVTIFDIECVEYMNFGNATLNRLCNPFTKPVVNMMGGTYRWADDYGKTWALKKEDLKPINRKPKPQTSVFKIQYPNGRQVGKYKTEDKAKEQIEKEIKSCQDIIDDYANTPCTVKLWYGGLIPWTPQQEKKYRDEHVKQLEKTIAKFQNSIVVEIK